MSKRRFSPLISSSDLDAIYDQAMAAGALGGKLLGAGGGGYFLFFAPPFGRHQICQALQASGFQTDRIMFEEEGLQAWKVRQALD